MCGSETRRPGRGPAHGRRRAPRPRRPATRSVDPRPWANLIVAGFKTVENRTWPTTHRGELCIHGGRVWEPSGAALASDRGFPGFADPRACPGGYLGMVRLPDVHPAAGCCEPWGEPGPGVYHWLLTEPRAFPQPIPGPGRLGLYWLPADLLPQET